MYNESIKKDKLCLKFDPLWSSALVDKNTDNAAIGETDNTYNMSAAFPYGKISLGDKIYIYLADVDETTGNDEIGRGYIIFNGDSIINQRVGSSDVTLEFFY